MKNNKPKGTIRSHGGDTSVSGFKWLIKHRSNGRKSPEEVKALRENFLKSDRKKSDGEKNDLEKELN